MAVYIYALLLVTLFGLAATFFWFIKFSASFLSLITASHADPRDSLDVATGGLASVIRALRHAGNGKASRALLRNAMFFIVSFAITMAATLLLVELKTRHHAPEMVWVVTSGTLQE